LPTGHFSLQAHAVANTLPISALAAPAKWVRTTPRVVVTGASPRGPGLFFPDVIAGVRSRSRDQAPDVGGKPPSRTPATNERNEGLRSSLGSRLVPAGIHAKCSMPLRLSTPKEEPRRSVHPSPDKDEADESFLIHQEGSSAVWEATLRPSDFAALRSSKLAPLRSVGRDRVEGRCQNMWTSNKRLSALPGDLTLKNAGDRPASWPLPDESRLREARERVKSSETRIPSRIAS
jgi:hypothetical protein